MRPPWRAVGDDDVDRPQVGARRRVEPSGTNGPSGLRTVAPSRASEVCVPFPRPVEGRRRHEWRHRRGGAPLPIPNREVKPRCGDDTAGDRGKVVRRPPTTDGPNPKGWGLLFFCFGTKQKKTGAKIGLSDFWQNYLSSTKAATLLYFLVSLSMASLGFDFLL